MAQGHAQLRFSRACGSQPRSSPRKRSARLPRAQRPDGTVPGASMVKNRGTWGLPLSLTALRSVTISDGTVPVIPVPPTRPCSARIRGQSGHGRGRVRPAAHAQSESGSRERRPPPAAQKARRARRPRTETCTWCWPCSRCIACLSTSFTPRAGTTRRSGSVNRSRAFCEAGLRISPGRAEARLRR